MYTVPPLKQIKILIIGIFLFFGVSAFALASHNTPATVHAPVEVLGYGWSENIGWISFNCSNDLECGTSNYKVQINTDNTVTGFAWSPNIGWIEFGGLSGFPTGGGTYAGNARMTGTSGNWNIQGWARALAYTDSQAGGWDGWISLSGTGYGAGFDNTANFSTGSYAWGGDVIGWISFSLTYLDTTELCVQPNSCNADFTGITSYDLWCTQSVSLCNTTPDDVCYATPPICGVSGITGTLAVTPLLVREGGTVDVSWVINDPVDSCIVKVNDGNTWNNGDTIAALTFKTSIFTLWCVPAGGGVLK